MTGTSTKSFNIDGTQYGAQNKGDNLYVGDKIILRENISGTTYTTQGTVTSVNASTGAVTVNAWDSGATFPPSGYSSLATVFKWQREWWDPTGVSFSTHRNAITQLTFRPTEYALGANIWLDDLRYGGPYLTTPTGSSVLSSTGKRYFQYQAIQSSTDTNVSASLVSVTLDYNANSPPGAPTLDSPADTAVGQSLTPTLQTTATDPDGDYERYKIEICTNLAMTTCVTGSPFTQADAGGAPDWSGMDTQTNTAYQGGPPSGGPTQASFTVPAGVLSPGTLYYWRSYARDPGGTNIFGSTQTPRSFTTTAVPTAPSNLLLNGSPSPVTGVAPGSTPSMSAQFNSPTVGDTTTQAEIQVSTSSDFTAPITHWNSGILTIVSTIAGAQSPNITYAGAALQFNTVFYWRIRFRDTSGNIGAWSSAAQFTTTGLFPPPCTLKKADDNSSITIQWTDNNTVEDGYTIEKNTDGAGFSALTTTASNVASFPDNTVSSGHTYAYRVRAFTTVGSQTSDWCTSATLSLQLGNFRFN